MKVWREIGATAVTAAALLLALSVTQGWNWPFLSDARAGIIALAVVGIGACALSGSAAASYDMRDPLLIAAFVAGVVVLGVGVVGLFVNAMPYLVVMMIATVALWIIATVRHYVEARPATRRTVTA